MTPSRSLTSCAPSPEEYIETLLVLEQKQEQEKQAEQNEARRQQEAARLAEAARLRDLARLKRERDEIERGKALEKINLLKQTPVGQRAFADLKPEELRELNADDIVAKQVNQLEKEKRELQSRVCSPGSHCCLPRASSGHIFLTFV